MEILENQTVLTNFSDYAYNENNFLFESPKRTEEFFIKTEKPDKIGYSDRFIPLRKNNKALLEFSLKAEDNKKESDSQEKYKKVLKDTLFENASNSLNIFKYMPEKQFENNEITEFFDESLEKDKKQKKKSKISQKPIKILDAPNLPNDYYVNVLDWSRNNLIAVSLKSAVYLWNAGNQQIFKLPSKVEDENYLKFTSAVGQCDGVIKIWDIEKSKYLYKARSHTSRIGVIDWNPISHNIFATGSRDKKAIIHDLRINSALNCYQEHKGEVTGIKWSSNGWQLASGGNDNLINIYSLNTKSIEAKYKKHNAAVRALAWNPNCGNMLASGGGTKDMTIKIWNTLSHQLIHSFENQNVNSQVTNLSFSETSQELVSTHGFGENMIKVWDCQNHQKRAEFVAHNDRVLYMAYSPNRDCIATGAGDETIKIWKIFPTKLSRQSKNKELMKFDLR